MRPQGHLNLGAPAGGASVRRHPGHETSATCELARAEALLAAAAAAANDLALAPGWTVNLCNDT